MMNAYHIAKSCHTTCNTFAQKKLEILKFILSTHLRPNFSYTIYGKLLLNIK